MKHQLTKKQKQTNRKAIDKVYDKMGWKKKPLKEELKTFKHPLTGKEIPKKLIPF